MEKIKIERRTEEIFFLNLPRTDGTSGPDWIRRFHWNITVSDRAKAILCSSKFVPTTIGTIIEIAILPGKNFERFSRSNINIQDEAKFRGWKCIENISPDIGCLICENITSEQINDMGLKKIVVMHKPIHTGVIGRHAVCGENPPSLLAIDAQEDRPKLDAGHGYPGSWLEDHLGFAFVSQMY